MKSVNQKTTQVFKKITDNFAIAKKLCQATLDMEKICVKIGI